jgi:hypothetical protein
MTDTERQAVCEFPESPCPVCQTVGELATLGGNRIVCQHCGAEVVGGDDE